MNTLDSFPVQNVVLSGEEYVLIQSDVFYSLFQTVAKYGDLDGSLVDNLCKHYTNAKKIKRKRIRLKKEKEALLGMYEAMVRGVIKREEPK